MVKTITGNGTAQSKDYEVSPIFSKEQAIMNDIIVAGGAFAGFTYALAPGPNYFSDFVRACPLNRDTHFYLLACRGE